MDIGVLKAAVELERDGERVRLKLRFSVTPEQISRAVGGYAFCRADRTQHPDTQTGHRAALATSAKKLV